MTPTQLNEGTLKVMMLQEVMMLRSAGLATSGDLCPPKRPVRFPQLPDHQTALRLTPKGGGERGTAWAPSPPPEADNDNQTSGTEEVATAALDDRDVVAESDTQKRGTLLQSQVFLQCSTTGEEHAQGVFERAWVPDYSYSGHFYETFVALFCATGKDRPRAPPTRRELMGHPDRELYL
ncbi:hypothetical protein SEPCBS119000_002615 [Sporothrix epigloea]|uniref:Uncharacterized protein n=1 Tax=Sporothrix epigloea TaxID=1892477 RepID=A0ABP0DIE5_9PEZI